MVMTRSKGVKFLMTNEEFLINDQCLMSNSQLGILVIGHWGLISH